MGKVSEEHILDARKKLTNLFGKDEAEAMLRILKEDFKEEELFSGALERVLLHHPIQYVVGYTLFMGCRIEVDPSVLIPRPETEELVELILKENGSSVKRVMDIGTGSGCIPIALGKKRPDWRMYATDVSPSALKLAVENARINGVKIEFWLNDILREDLSFLPTDLDILVSNPPYITKEESGDMTPEVLEHEPHLALFVGNKDPLQFYKVIGNVGGKLLRSGGQLWLECNARYATEVSKLLSEQGYMGAEVIQDMSGKGRFVRALRK